MFKVYHTRGKEKGKGKNFSSFVRSTALWTDRARVRETQSGSYIQGFKVI